MIFQTAVFEVEEKRRAAVQAVIAVADTAATIAVKGVGLAADAAIGTMRLTGRAIGAAADVALPAGER